MLNKQLINDEHFTNIHKAQAGLTKLFMNAEKKSIFYRVMKADKPLGVLVPNEMWASITEDLEALSSPNFREKISKSRKGPRIKAEEIRKAVGI